MSVFMQNIHNKRTEYTILRLNTTAKTMKEKQKKETQQTL